MRTKIILVTGILAFMGLLSSCRDSSSSPQEKKASKSNSAVVNDAAFTGGGDVRPLTEGRLGARERELDDKMPMNASAADDAKTEERFVDQLASKCVGFFNNRESQMGLVVIDDPPRVEVTFTDALGTPFARATR